MKVAAALVFLVLAGAASAQAPRRTINWPAVSACIKRLYAQRSADWVIALRCDPRRSEFAVKPRVVAGVEPSGFREASALEPAASWVAGKPVRVWCATTETRWAAVARARTGGDALGFADAVSGANAYLTPGVCVNLSRAPRADGYAFGQSLFVLLHEAEHLAGVADESEADCGALRAVATASIRFFGVRKHGLLHLIAGSALDEHNQSPPDYQRGC